jgi:hypothetical protein
MFGHFVRDNQIESVRTKRADKVVYAADVIYAYTLANIDTEVSGRLESLYDATYRASHVLAADFND